MNNQPQSPQSSSEEIDLGQLFQLIGNAFKKLFNFISNIFKGVFDLLITLLFFIQKQFIKLTIVGIIGLAIGIYLDMNKEPKYISSMVIEPNFNSVQQLYNNVSFYNELAEAEDSTALAEALDISSKEAITIKKFEVESYSDDNQKVLLFDKFVRSLDTTTQRAIDIESYLKNFNSLDARFHTVSVTATSNSIAKKIQNPIINSIDRNEYFNLQKQTSDKNIEFQEVIYNKQLSEIDSLQKLYKTVLIKQADKPMQGTNINLGGEGKSENKELAIINERDLLKQSLVELNEERANKSSILNVISAFPRKGVEIKGLFKSYKFLIPLFLIGMTLLILSLQSLNNYLKTHIKK
ncbi:hypothetical protein KO500_06060 [Cellulophaga baltica]|uniref:hypothetical protein n=1 Tax=Cellulophaga TaxID=104264 RepID=UPI001C0756C8|nr:MULTISPECIES: hypothetical protein [Cellulophaga]MBU2995987.1 hypothetical protein [Cellulophaga baltica]MDO6767382.1 hypothetical protein [Cellulophaga sp. 1_MG-2023]